MGNLSDAFQQALADQAKTALSQVVAKNPNTTISELSKLVGSAPQLGAMTLDQLLSHNERAPGKARLGSQRRKTGAAGSPAKAKNTTVIMRDVRRQSGRDRLDADVLEALTACGGQTISATQVRLRLSADPTQLRTSLNRLIHAGKLSFSGKARGTRYSLI